MSLEFNSYGTPGNYIVDDIGTIVSRVRERWITFDNTNVTWDSTEITFDGGKAPFYAYGHKLEVAKALAKKNKVSQKYPIVFLVMDFPEEKARGILTATLNIGLITYTKEHYNAQERYTEVFKKHLYRLYDMFFEELFKSGLFFWDGKDDQIMPEHTKIDRPFWGTDGEQNQTGQKKNSKYIFNTDPLDCIEIVNLRLSQAIKK